LPKLNQISNAITSWMAYEKKTSWTFQCPNQQSLDAKYILYVW
jgi:hypothetical protein